MLEIMALYNIPAGEVACSSGHLLAYHLHYRQMNGKAKVSVPYIPGYLNLHYRQMNGKAKEQRC